MKYKIEPIKQDNTKVTPKLLSKPKPPVKTNTTSEFIFNPKTGKSEYNPNAKMGLENVSPEFQIMTAGVGSLGNKAVSTAGKIGQTMLHGAGQGAMANMSNLSGSEQNLEGLATDVLGGAIVGGALKGVGIGAKTVKQNVHKINPLTKKLIDKNISLQKFQSEVDWGKWNSEIPANKPLMKEYQVIEQTAKQNGTWMKYSDGSRFDGTPEQFVQQNSENFKKAYPNGNELTYRGVLKNNKNLSEYGDNIDNTVFTANRELANRYGNRTDDPLRPLIKNKNDKTGVYELYSKNSNNQLYLDAVGDDWTSIDLSDIDYKKSLLKHSIQQQKENLPRFLDNKKVYDIMQNRLTTDLDRFKRIDNIIDDRIKIRNDLRNNNDLNRFVDIKDETWTDGLAKYIKDKNINKIKINDINDGGYGTVIINNQKPGNYLKSAIGNNGMFDMTNPNIYKAILPTIGSTATFLNKNKNNNH